MMRREFNTTGSCNPQQHYMVDTTKRFEAVESLIEKGKYFTINRARQYGKTTMLDMIWRKMSGNYLVIGTSFEGVGNESFHGQETFVQTFAKLMLRELEKESDELKAIWRDESIKDFSTLSQTITTFCQTYSKPVVLLIDEVDKSSDNDTFIAFIGMLRNKYLERNRQGMDSTFLSVVLAGVYDVKNLKLRLRPDAERKYNSPWNIAADFNVDMTFHPDEIAQMLADYENDNHTGMDRRAISEEIYKYTTGYPYLVSYICKAIDEQMQREWTSESIVKAVKMLVEGGSTLMDDLSKNLENNAEFREFMFSVAVNGVSYPFSLLNPMVNMGNMFSYIRKTDGHVAIHNLIFEEALYLYFTLDYTMKNSTRLAPFQMSYVHGGRLDMEHVVTRFRDLLREEYRDSTVPFLEREGRLLLLTFLKPIINGVGFYYVEPQTRSNRRMDLVVTYGKEEFIVELKIWRGDTYEEQGRDQLAGYLATRGKNEGYLITFDFSKPVVGEASKLCTRQDEEPHWTEHLGKRIFEVVV